MKFLHSPERKKEERELVEKSLKYGLDLKFLQDQRAEKHLRDEPDLSGRLYVVMEQVRDLSPPLVLQPGACPPLTRFLNHEPVVQSS